MKRAALLAGALLLTTWGVALDVRASSPATRSSTILFTSGKPTALRLLDAKTGRVRVLRAGRGPSMTPAWSPDGRFIAYSSRGEIGIVPAAGGATRQLTHNNIPDVGPSWSRDGRRLAFFEQPRQINTTVVRDDLMSVNADGRDLRKLATASVPNRTISWSHDGRSIILTLGAVGTSDVFALSADNGSRKQLTHDGSSRSAVVSSEGAEIAFIRGTGDRYELAVMAIDGSGFRVVRSTTTPLRQPAWSPDGRSLVFVSGRAPRGRLELVSSDGSAHRILTRSQFWSDSPAWSPDGLRIAYVRRRPNSRPSGGVIATVPVSGEGSRIYANAQVTDHELADPQWKP